MGRSTVSVCTAAGFSAKSPPFSTHTNVCSSFNQSSSINISKKVLTTCAGFLSGFGSLDFH